MHDQQYTMTHYVILPLADKVVIGGWSSKVLCTRQGMLPSQDKALHWVMQGRTSNTY